MQAGRPPEEGQGAVSKGSASRGTTGPFSHDRLRPLDQQNDRAWGRPLGASCHLRGGTRDCGLIAEGVSRACMLRVLGWAGREAARGGGASPPSRKATSREDPISHKATEAQRRAVTCPRPHVLARRELGGRVSAAPLCAQHAQEESSRPVLTGICRCQAFKPSSVVSGTSSWVHSVDVKLSPEA